tara:strand:+ start:354 stop:1454 length:1101 start_codon:yes stop_codon:yes gene_type:complete
MATYNLKYNKDDSVIRHIIIGLLADLNSKLSFWRQISNDERSIVDVPFFYAVSGDENFIKDNFLFSNVNGIGCDPDGQFADGNYDKVPRGIVNLTSFAVDPGKLVNKRNIGNYTMMNNQGLMEGYVAEFEIIPCIIGVDIEILLSSQLDMFKVTEAIIKNMYKANFFHVDAGHIEDGMYRISSEYMMPDDYTQERPIEYGFDDKENHKITFSLEINTFMPSFDFENDIYTKFTRSVYPNGVIGNYGNPNNVALDPSVLYSDYTGDMPDPVQYIDNNGSVWEWDPETQSWIQKESAKGDDYVVDDSNMGTLITRNSQLVRTSKRRKNSNRMFKFGNTTDFASNVLDKDKPLLGDHNEVTSTDLPFDE